MAKPLRRTIYQYTAVFDPAEEGGYTVTVPTLPGCISQGDTFEEALANIKEAASLYLEVMRRDLQRPPRETDPAFTVPVKIRL